jgi:hypothetical protein
MALNGDEHRKLKKNLAFLANNDCRTNKRHPDEHDGVTLQNSRDTWS